MFICLFTGEFLESRVTSVKVNIIKYLNQWIRPSAEGGLENRIMSLIHQEFLPLIIVLSLYQCVLVWSIRNATIWLLVSVQR